MKIFEFQVLTFNKKGGISFPALLADLFVIFI
jgi:hypothetical protein